ncbi:asparagine synthase-related protein [Streptomyces sp. NPDC058989]|uniref:asparagine synthase-related protein n=1 Tax=Streptomyces sp. NPDC058989 TaxID=3346686 RepID=UPI00367899BC
MYRFVVGRATTERVLGGVEPRCAQEVLALPQMQVWESGHEATETTVTALPSEGSGAQLATVGHCLASEAERQKALETALAGDLRPALRLPGSHLTVLRIDDSVWVAGDRAGVVPVYWLPHEGGIWWATVAAPLAALIGATPNLSWLLGEVALSGVGFRSHTAPFEQVSRVPPGGALAIDPGCTPRVVAADAPESVGLTEGVERVRTAFTTAVVRRAHRWERVSADLSGGVDSSTIACVAATARPLLAVTYTDARMSDEDDVHYARRVADAYDGITHQLINGTQAGAAHFDGLSNVETLPFTDTPSLTLGLLAIKDAQLAPAAAHGSQAHLTGRGGDNVLDTVGTYLVDQLLAGQHAMALRRATAFARSHHMAPWTVWRQMGQTAAISYPQALERMANAFARMQPHTGPQQTESWQSLAWCSPTAGAGWLTRSGRALVAELVNDCARRSEPHVTPAALHERLALEWMADSHATFAEIARQRWALSVHAPYLDTAVVDACLGIPSFQRVRPGTYKPLAQVAFAGLAPDWLLTRSTKTFFTSSVYAGLATNAPTLRRIVNNSLLAQAGLIDARRVTTALEAAIAGAPAPLAELHSLLVIELWLSRLRTTHATWWQPKEDSLCP